MIVIEKFYVDERLFNRVYSDSDRYVVRDGIEYTEACDPVEFGRKYIEGREMPIEKPDVVDKAAAYDILMGVSE